MSSVTAGYLAARCRCALPGVSYIVACGKAEVDRRDTRLATQGTDNMYGQIHVCIRSLVQSKFGEEAWQKILEKSGLNAADHFLIFHIYPDADTLALVGAITEVLGAPLDTVLEIFGEYFFQYCLDTGYDKMLRMLGDSFQSFLQNLDSLHALLAMSYPNINAPSFRCEEEGAGILVLHYYSSRQGLHHIVVGLLRAVGKELFNTDPTIEILEVAKEPIMDGTEQSHVTFRITMEEEVTSSEQQLSDGSTSDITDDHDAMPVSSVFLNGSMSSLVDHMDGLISPKTFCRLFPFHILFDRSLRIVQCGTNIIKMSRMAIKRGAKMNDVFTLINPKTPLSYHHILIFINASFLLKMKSTESNTKALATVGKEKEDSLILKGQMVWLEEIDHVIFIGSPRLSSLTELMERNVYLSDIPLYDVTRELVLLNQQRLAEVEISKKLDETTAELTKTGLALEKEKAKTDMLLNQMLPAKVADQLKRGQRVDAEKFECSTILFSDIVTFTNIAAAVQPISIVNMLNELYSKFDLLTSLHNVYKVETIGDAYMVVGGVPEVSARHAHDVASFSLDMVVKAAEVKSPATGLSLQIRVGFHSGPVVAGVVGDKMPRYCLFGDTVNTASRMESHGEPGRIHVSPSAHSALKEGYFLFETRGEIQVKGKGLMTTYFLLGEATKEMSHNNGDLVTVNKEMSIINMGSVTSDLSHMTTNHADIKTDASDIITYPADITTKTDDVIHNDEDANNSMTALTSQELDIRSSGHTTPVSVHSGKMPDAITKDDPNNRQADAQQSALCSIL